MHKRLFGLLASGAILAAACGGAQQSSAPSATTNGSSNPSSTAPSASTSSAPTAEQTLTMVMDGDVSGGLSNAADNVPTAEAIQFLYDGIYTYDNTLTPQPNLSTSLADISPDGKVWTIKLKSGLKFHDGTDLNSADVVQTYQLAASPNCRYNPSICLTGFLTDIKAVDDLTVQFTLKDPLATFATVYLPAIFIESKDAIDASYQKYLAGTKQLTAAEVKTVVDAVDAENKTPTGAAGTDGKATVNWDALIPQLEAVITKAGQTLPDKAAFVDADGKPDPSAYGAELSKRVTAINETFIGSQTDALAAAYPYLDFQNNPVGSGPFQFVSYKSGESLEYKAFAGYHEGAPQISKLFIPIIKDDLAGGQALVAGQVDWKYSLEGATYNQIKDDPNLKFVEYPDFGFFGVYFNMHPDAHALFADKNLRQAMAYCFDKVETVKAATEAQGVPVYSDIPPASWAYPASGLNEYAFDPAKGMALIEQSGWKKGSDGIYEKDGKKLSTIVAVRAGRPNRSAFMQLLSDQVKTNCGMDISYKEVDFSAILTMLDNYPHINAAAPESKKPFDAYFGGFSTSLDPDPYSLYHSSQCSTAKNPETFNYECYQNPEVDKLIEQGLKEFDQTKRAAIYQQYAKLQSDDLPVLYGWSDIAREGLRKTVDSSAGPLQMDTPTWFWQIEKLTNQKS
jgi:ABC-type transport system substrate-binding protein